MLLKKKADGRGRHQVGTETISIVSVVVGDGHDAHIFFQGHFLTGRRTIVKALAEAKMKLHSPRKRGGSKCICRGLLIEI